MDEDQEPQEVEQEQVADVVDEPMQADAPADVEQPPPVVEDAQVEQPPPVVDQPPPVVDEQPEPVADQVDEVKEDLPIVVDAYNGDLPATITSACDILYSDNPSFNWMVTNLTDAKKGKDGLVMEKVGSGGLNELKAFVQDKKSNIMFFLLRVNTYDDEGSSRAKFIYGRFMGTGVKFMQKAKLTPKLGEIADEFQVKHLSRDADEEMKDWDPETLGKEFLRIGGAHKPSKYDFGPNAVYNCK